MLQHVHFAVQQRVGLDEKVRAGRRTTVAVRRIVNSADQQQGVWR